VHAEAVDVAGDDDGRLATERDGLAARRSGRVVHRGASRQIGVPREQRLGRVLHHERALREPGQLVRPASAGHETRAVGCGLGRDPGNAPAALQLRGTLSRRLEHEQGPAVVPLQEPPGLLGSEPREPALDQPFGVRVPPGEPGRVHRLLLRRPLRPCRRFGLRVQAAQHRVDEPSGARSAFLASQRDRRVHRCVRRHPVESDQLIRAEPEQVLQSRRDFGPVAGHQRREPGIERLLPAQDAGGHLVRQPAVVILQLPQRPVERRIQRPAGAHLGQDVKRSSPRRQPLVGGHRHPFQA
jgi:hypothetical protein